MGFCYRITCTHNGKIYLGRRHIWRPGDGRPTNWPVYFGSSTHLHRDIRLMGLDHFTREILSFHTSPGALNREEVKLIHHAAKTLGTDGIYNKGVPSRGSVILLNRVYPQNPPPKA